MPQFNLLRPLLVTRGMQAFADMLAEKEKNYFNTIRNGNLAPWQCALERLPKLRPSTIQLNSATIKIGAAADCTDAQRTLLATQLRALMPWRKGPFDWFGLHLDAEWRSDLKWQRCAAAIGSLKGQLVLDVGCGNAYYGFRMLGAGADAVIGIDPSLLFVMQFRAANTYIASKHIHVFPFRLAQLEFTSLQFDCVFSMGVLYHQRNPRLHLRQLYQALAPGGTLVLESLILGPNEAKLLKPTGRYAKMNNVWQIPSGRLLLEWVTESGFSEAELMSDTITTQKEQRRSAWMQFESLADFLSTDDPTKTIEGYPAPRRGMIFARKPHSLAKNFP